MRELLVVDGYNILFSETRYRALIDSEVLDRADARHSAKNGHSYSMPEPRAEAASSLRAKPYALDPFVRSKEALLADVAAYSMGSYDAYIVYDAALNKSPTRDNSKIAGVNVLYSPQKSSADELIERLVVDARAAGKASVLVTNDSTIRFSVGGFPIKKMSCGILLSHITAEEEIRTSATQSWSRMTLENRLSPEARDKLWALIQGT